MYPPKRQPVDDISRRFWLKHFTDEEIGELAGSMFGRSANVEHIRAERERLFGKAVA